MDGQYSNQITPVLLATLEQSPYTPEQLAAMNDDVRATIEAQKAFCAQHPVTAVYRIAVAGCRTRDGGTGAEFNPAPDEGNKIQCADGKMRSVLTAGSLSLISYPDGRTARIVSSAGSQYRDVNGCGIALVGSRLDNGDVIISTPQDACMLVGREGVAQPPDFLSHAG
ncbi:hypothetical protein RJ498_003568 [Pluralibacter gergoviae]